MRFPAALTVAPLLGVLITSSAHAQRGTVLHAGTAGQLADLCAADPRQELGDAKVNYCHGFAQGAVDVILHDAGANKPFCFPSPAPKRTETLNEFVRWVRADSSRARLAAAGGLDRFFRDRFPCGK